MLFRLYYNEVMSIVGIFSIVLFFLPSYGIIRAFFFEKPWWYKFSFLTIISIILIPLTLFYLNLLHIPLNKLSAILVIVGVNALTIILTKRLKPSQSKFAKPPIAQSLMYGGLVLLAAVVFNYPYVFNSQPIIGGDTPHYLRNSQELIDQGYPTLVFDRNIIYFFPAILHLISGLSVEVILKIIIAAFELVFIITSISLAEKFIKPKLLVPFGIALIFSPTIIDMSKFIIPFFMGITVIYFLLDQILSAKKLSHLFFIPLFWGALFNLHGVIAFASIGLLLPIIGYLFYKHKYSFKTSLLWLVAFILTSYPLLTNQGGKLYGGLIAPIKNTILSSDQGQTTSQPSKSEVWADEFTNTKSRHIAEFPFHKDTFKSSYSYILVFSVYGLIIFAKTKQKNHKIILTISILLFLLTQQEFFGLNWFPVRFVFAMSPLVLLLAFYGVDDMIVNRFKKSTGLYLAVGFITMPSLLFTLPKLTHLTANISQPEYRFIQSLKSKIEPGDVIFVAAPSDEWIKGLLDGVVVYRTHFDAVCGDGLAKTRISGQMWEVGQAFSAAVDVSESIGIFTSTAQSQNYFVYLDTENFRCINGDLFPADRYQQIARQDNLYLLKHQEK